MKRIYSCFVTAVISTASFAQFGNFLVTDGFHDSENSANDSKAYRTSINVIEDDSDYTYECLFKTCDTKNSKIIDALGGTGGRGFDISISNSTISLRMNGNGTPSEYATFPQAEFSKDDWHHIALSYSVADSTGTLYLDGEAIGSVKSAQDGLQDRLCIGCSDVYSASTHMNGYIDEVRVSNVPRYTSNFVVPSSEFVVDNNTMALYHFNEVSGSTVFSDESINEFDITGSGNVKTNAYSFDVGTDASICTDANITLSASGGTSYSWLPTIGLDDPSIATPIASPSETTIYTVSVGHDDNSCLFKEEVTITVDACTGIDVQAISEIVNLSPNPVHGLLTITSDLEISINEIHMLNGSLIGSFEGNSFSTESLVAGIYLIKSFTTAGIIVQRFVKN